MYYSLHTGPAGLSWTRGKPASSTFSLSVMQGNCNVDHCDTDDNPLVHPCEVPQTDHGNQIQGNFYRTLIHRLDKKK